MGSTFELTILYTPTIDWYYQPFSTLIPNLTNLKNFFKTILFIKQNFLFIIFFFYLNVIYIGNINKGNISNSYNPISIRLRHLIYQNLNVFLISSPHCKGEAFKIRKSILNDYRSVK